jgi:hypothetical protein
MANPLSITVENPDELLNTGYYGAGALVRVERSSTGGGIGFSEVGTAAIVTATTLYPYYDAAGIAGDYYRVRYSKASPSVPADYSVYGAEFQGGVQSGLCSLADLKQRLPGTTSADDEELLQLITQVTTNIHRYCHRYFLPDPPTGTTTYLFDGNDVLHGGRMLYVQRGIQSISLLRAAWFTNGDWHVIPSTDYFLMPNQQDRDPGDPATQLWMTDFPKAQSNSFGPYFRWGMRNIEVTGVFGYAEVPADVEYVALTMAVRLWRTRQGGQTDSVMPPEAGQAVISRLLSIDERNTLRSYRTPVY